MMKARYAVAVSAVVGAVLGGAAVQGLHAQAKPPVYYIAEIEITNLEGWTKEYAPRAQALIRESGGRTLASGQKVTSLEGEPPKTRVAVQVWESMDQLDAWRAKPLYKELNELRQKYGKVRAFTVEGLPN